VRGYSLRKVRLTSSGYEVGTLHYFGSSQALGDVYRLTSNDDPELVEEFRARTRREAQSKASKIKEEWKWDSIPNYNVSKEHNEQ
jgi:hypothetical protein